MKLRRNLPHLSCAKMANKDLEDTDFEELRKETAEYLFQYLNKGVINEEEVIENLIPEDSDLPKDKIDSYDELVDIHFLMQEEVVDFIENLEKRLRTIKTDTKSKKVVNRGQVDGKIDWEATTKKRYSENPSDKSLFVVSDKQENHDIDRNILLKRYLKELIQTFDSVDNIISDKDWAENKWDLDQSTSKIDKLNRIFHNNVHIQRIRELKDYEPTERMVKKGKSSRKQIYREAADGLEQKKKFDDGKEVSDLLNTVVQPKDDTIFELGLIFKTINHLENRAIDYTLKKIESNNTDEKWIAKIDLDENHSIKIYHDSTTEETDFKPDNAERQEKITEQYANIVKDYFDSGSRETTMRPDMILKLEDNEVAKDYLLAEVKNKDYVQGAKKAAEELLEYMAYGSKNGDEIFEEDGGRFGNGFNGILFTRKLNAKTHDLDDKHSIKILQYDNEWGQNLISQLEGWLQSNGL